MTHILTPLKSFFKMQASETYDDMTRHDNITSSHSLLLKRPLSYTKDETRIMLIPSPTRIVACTFLTG